LSFWEIASRRTSKKFALSKILPVERKLVVGGDKRTCGDADWPVGSLPASLDVPGTLKLTFKAHANM
jgi:hypothetical protein